MLIGMLFLIVHMFYYKNLFQLCLYDAGVNISRCPLVFSCGAGRGRALHQDAAAGLPGPLRPVCLCL